MIYPVICTNPSCRHKGDVLAPASQCANLRCPECGAKADQDYAAKNIGNGNREFHGTKQESISEWWHPREVAEVRQQLGKSGHCVQADGTVRFKDRQEQRRYMADKRAMKHGYDLQNAATAELARRDPVAAARELKARDPARYRRAVRKAKKAAA